MLPMRKFGNKEVVDWKAISKGFEFMLNETRCEVVSNEMVSKVSRNGKTRRERRLTVRVVGTEVAIEVSATSFKNMSFGKRLAKAMGKAPKPKAKGTYELSTYVHEHGYLRDALMNAKQYEYSEDFGFERAKVDYMEFQNNYWNEELENVLNNEKMNSLTKEKLIEGIKNSWEKCLEDVERQWEWYYSMAKFANCHSLSDVKKMYRELCSKEHPDKGGDAMKFKAITKAYEEAKQREEEKMNKATVNMADLFAEFGFNVA